MTHGSGVARRSRDDVDLGKGNRLQSGIAWAIAAASVAWSRSDGHPTQRRQASVITTAV